MHLCLFLYVLIRSEVWSGLPGQEAVGFFRDACCINLQLHQGNSVTDILFGAYNPRFAQRKTIISLLFSIFLVAAYRTPLVRVSPTTLRRSSTPHPRRYCRSHILRESSSTIGILMLRVSLLDLNLGSGCLLRLLRILGCRYEALHVVGRLQPALAPQWTLGALHLPRLLSGLTRLYRLHDPVVTVHFTLKNTGRVAGHEVGYCFSTRT
jgi:hypothetical protein